MRPDSVRRWGTMTAHQMVCHCADACRMALGEATPRDISTGATRHVIKWIALYAPMRWPAGVQTVEEFDQRTAGTRPDGVRGRRRRARAAARTGSGRRGGAWPPHPIFGPMSEAAWLRWAYLHMDHHLRQFGA